ncbi:MAG: saccharopine dehydrogenase NADP-binding domain-containing protein [Butyrivibrio sp.]|nr:saccharopine dehydrogenase NADP-binding domain-containing protein [Butyrivibrio sp.]
MYESKIMIFGFGGVGKSLFNIIVKENLFALDNILVVDCTRKAFRFFEKCGGKRENCILFRMDSKCYGEVLDELCPGDFFIYLAVGNDNLVLAKECAKRGIHFLCTTDDTFSDQPFTEPFRYKTHFKEYKELMDNSAGGATSVLQFGSNPGLISILTKKALIEIVQKDESDFVSRNRHHLQKLVKEGEYAELAKELRVSAFVETDLDTTISDYTEDDQTAYSTWSIADFEGEMNDRSIQKLGSEVTLSEHLDRIGVSVDEVYYYSKEDGTLVIDKSGKDITTGGYVKNEYMEGCVDAHEEVFSIHDYYTIRDEDGEISYAPSVMFVYRPCEIALNSVYHEENIRGRLITNERMLSGGEIIGICVEGKNFNPIYVGTELYYDKDAIENPTVLLVSASVYAAIRFMHDHPDKGVLFPEYLDVDEILSHVSPWLPVIVSRTGLSGKSYERAV